MRVWRRRTLEFIWTTSNAVQTLWGLFDFDPIEKRFGDKSAGIDGQLWVRNPSGPGLHVYDGKQRLRMELDVDRAGGFMQRGGDESIRRRDCS